MQVSEKEQMMTTNAVMSCPTCNVALVMSERQGIEIDYCPQCRGIWLDRGELDKIIERSAAPVQGDTLQPSSDRAHSRDPHYRGKKRKSFLSELFD